MTTWSEKYDRRYKTKTTISVKLTDQELAQLDALRGPLHDFNPEGDREPRGEVLRRLLKHAGERKTEQLELEQQRLTKAPASSSYDELEPAIAAAANRKTPRARQNRKTPARSPNRLTARPLRKTGGVRR